MEFPGGLVKTQMIQSHPQSFGLSRPGLRPENEHFYQVYR